MKQLKIKQATSKGYEVLNVPGLADFSYPSSKTRRGRVQGGGQISPTITTHSEWILYVEDVEE